MDADDICALDRFEKQIQFLDSHPEIDIVGSQPPSFRRPNRKRTRFKRPPLLDKDIKAFPSCRPKHVQPHPPCGGTIALKNLGINHRDRNRSRFPYVGTMRPTWQNLCQPARVFVVIQDTHKSRKPKKRQNQQIRPTPWSCGSVISSLI